MIINAEHDWSVIEALEIRQKDPLYVIFKATEKNNEHEVDNILDSTGTAFRV